MAKAIFFCCLGLLVVSCSSETPKENSPASTEHSRTVPPASVEAKEVAAEENAPNVVEIKFKKNSSKLTSSSIESLKKFTKQSSNTGKIKEVKTIAWSDAEYPSTSTKTLSKSDIQLADRRNRAVANFLKSNGISAKITAYNMSKRPNLFQDWLSTSDAQIKKSFESAGIPNTDTAVKIPAKASKAIIMSISE